MGTTETPSFGRFRPAWKSSSISLARLMGMANPMPMLPLGPRIAVLMPTTLPAESSSGPPLLPGLMAASVWIKPSSVRSFSPRMLRPSELTMPVVKVPSRPNGLPMASTFWPTCSPSESPRCSEGSFARGCDLQQRQVVGFVAAQQLRLVARLIGQRHFQLALIGHHVAVGENLAVRADQEARALVLGGVNFKEDGAPIDGAGDVHGGQMRRLIDVDVVRLIGA